MLTGLPNLPAETIIGYIGILIGTISASAFWYWKNYRAPEPARKVAEDLVLTSGVIGDMAPVRRAADALDRIAKTCEEMVEEQVRLRHALEKISQRLETNAEIALHRHRGDFS